MGRQLVYSLSALLAIASFVLQLPLPVQGLSSSPVYPPTPRRSASSIYHGINEGTVIVDDPYRWLERDSSERRAWALAQEQFSADYLRSYPGQATLQTAVEQSHNYTQFEAPFLAQDGRWYWMARSGSQKQPAVYRSSSVILPYAGEDGLGDLEAESELFFDTNVLSKDGRKSLSKWSFSPDGRLVAYSISTFGSDTEEILICRSSQIASGQSLNNNKIETIKGTGYGVFAWGPQLNGIYYTQPSLFQLGCNAQSAQDARSCGPKVLWHKVGTPQADDDVVLVGELGSLFEISTSCDGAYLLLSISKDPTGAHKLWIAENKTPDNGHRLKWVKVKDGYDDIFNYIVNDGPLFYFITNAHSDRKYVVKWTFRTEDPVLVAIKHIPDSGSLFLRQYIPLNADYAVAVYSHNVRDELYLLQGHRRAQRLDPDFVGSITVRPTDTGFFATFTSYNTPALIKRLDWPCPLDEPSWKIWRDTKFGAFPLADFVLKQLWYNSKDGTSVPMFVLYEKSTKLDGTAPYLQYGFGDNNWSLLPFFSPLFLTFAHEFGGVVAIPTVRGGSEFGSRWSEAGSKANKVNSIDDSISATEYLVAQKYISSSKTGILGWGSGAHLAVNSVARAPVGTYGCAISDRCSYDMLRFPLFTPGLYWTRMYGNPFVPQDFDFIYPLSPLHNGTSNLRPPTLLLTGSEDVRMDALHGYKFAATLQNNAAPDSGIQLLKVIKGAGHDTGKSIDIEIEESVVKLVFLAQSLGLSPDDDVAPKLRQQFV